MAPKEHSQVIAADAALDLSPVFRHRGEKRQSSNPLQCSALRAKKIGNISYIWHILMTQLPLLSWHAPGRRGTAFFCE
jgi:hypothetical protein